MTKPAHAIAGRFTRLPIRWRLAATSAALTFVILLAFAIVVGAFTARQVRDHFDDDLRATVGDLGTRVRPTTTPQGLELIGSEAIRSAAAGDAVVRVIRASDGRILGRSSRRSSPIQSPTSSTPSRAARRTRRSRAFACS